MLLVLTLYSSETLSAIASVIEYDWWCSGSSCCNTDAQVCDKAFYNDNMFLRKGVTSFT